MHNPEEGISMAHAHIDTDRSGLGRSFKTGIIINLVFVAAEAVFGYYSNSMALIADAGHNLSDVLALVFSWAAVLLSQRKPSGNYTYGLRRSTILIAIVNTFLLLAAVMVIAWETIARLGRTVDINAQNVIIIASVGIFVNGLTAWMFMRSRKHDLNIKSAFLHFVADALVSLGVVVAGIIIIFTGIVWIDALVSLIIVAIILYSAYHLLMDSIRLALDGVPKDIDIKAVRDFLLSKPEVTGVHDLHVWALSTTDTALTVHLMARKPMDAAMIRTLQEELRQQFKIGHSTIQVEFNSTSACRTCCS